MGNKSYTYRGYIDYYKRIGNNICVSSVYHGGKEYKHEQTFNKLSDIKLAIDSDDWKFEK
jgi:hypothetical protein